MGLTSIFIKKARCDRGVCLLKRANPNFDYRVLRLLAIAIRYLQNLTNDNASTSVI